jgi:hypothetical protein
MVDLWRSGRNGGGGKRVGGRREGDRPRWSGNHINNIIVGGIVSTGIKINIMRSMIK